LTDFFNRVSFTLTEGAVSRPGSTAHNAKGTKVIKALKCTFFWKYAKGMTLAVLVSLASHASALAQKPTTPQTEPKQSASKPADSKPAPKKPYTLTVKTEPIVNISLKADKAKMSVVAQDLAKKLKVPVFLGPERTNELVTIEFSELTLEPALQLLSPTVYVDYEIDTGSMEPPKPLGIYFYDANQGEPPLTTAVNGTTQSFLVEGNTEDGVEPDTDAEKKAAEEQPLRITYLNNTFTIKAKKQSLAVVLLKIGEELGIPVEIQDQNTTFIDAEISKLPIEEVVRQLSPHIRLFLRADLTRAEKRALRLVLTEPKVAQETP
jgi:hypothetical protein